MVWLEPAPNVGVVRCLTEPSLAPEDLVAAHVARPAMRVDSRGFVRLNMVSSADGGTAVDGTSGGLGNRSDRAVFAALRKDADVVLVGMVTAVAEQYRAPEQPHLRVFVIAKEPNISGNPELFASGRATIVLPEDAPPVPAGLPELRAGTGGRVDLRAVVDQFMGRVVLMEGGPGLAGVMVSLGLVDEFFQTVAPKVISGGSARVSHGPGADPAPWGLDHGFVDDDGYLFLRYSRPGLADGAA